ncbi:MAG: hypothetical protein QOG42_437 [Solirubrobacteraceae bacterium]|jgi:hypothetical protein|nr:hypothetical protein [Solirubrobacteraceae bacterium]
MSGTRALFASIGASVSIVAAAALSLLAVSALFAFGGWSDPVAESARTSSLVLATDSDRAPTGLKPLVLPARPRARASRPVASVAPRSQGRVRAAERAAITPVTSRPPKASLEARSPAADTPPQAPAPPAPAAPKKSAGDGVRSAGQGLSGTVQSTGDALAQLTAPLLPPVTAATQKVLNTVAELLRRTTDGLGNVVDHTLPAG